MAKEFGVNVKRLLDGPNFAHLATLMEDGSPKVEPVWVGREGNNLFIVTHNKSIKSLNIRRDPRVALSIVDHNNPYEQVLIRGQVIEVRDDNELIGIDMLANIYLGTSADRDKFPPRNRVLYIIEPSTVRYYLSDLRHMHSE